MIDNPNLLCQSSNETFDDFFVRLFEHKDEYKLTCQDIADILNRQCGEEYGESKWRKEYAAFRRGMRYASEHRCSNGVCTRILCISDTHVPFNLPIETYSDYVGQCDILILNGDITDCQAISKFPKTYRVSPMRELIEARQYLIDLIKYISPKKVIVNYGNHDIRFQQYMAKNLDTDILELMPSTALELIVVDGFHHYDKENGMKTFYSPIKDLFDDVEIEYTNSWFCQVGQAIFCHPLAFSASIMKTSDKAVQFFRNEGYSFSTLVMAHTHRIGSYRQGTTMMYEQGCCCDTKKQHYADGRLTPSQKEGFLYLCEDKDGREIQSFTRIVCLN